MPRRTPALFLIALVLVTSGCHVYRPVNLDREAIEARISRGDRIRVVTENGRTSARFIAVEDGRLRAKVAGEPRTIPLDQVRSLEIRQWVMRPRDAAYMGAGTLLVVAVVGGAVIYLVSQIEFSPF